MQYRYYSKANQATADLRQVQHRVRNADGKKFGDPFVMEDRKNKETGEVTQVKVRRQPSAQRISQRYLHDLFHDRIWVDRKGR